jgi:hypothetical protein
MIVVMPSRRLVVIAAAAAALAMPAPVAAIPPDTDAVVVDGYRLTVNAAYEGSSAVTCPDGSAASATTTVSMTGTGNATGLPLTPHHSVALPPGRAGTTRASGATRYGTRTTRTRCGVTEGPTTTPAVAAFSTAVSFRFELKGGRLTARIHIDASTPLGWVRATSDASVSAAAARRQGGTRIEISGVRPVAVQPGDERGAGEARWSLSVPIRVVETRALLKFRSLSPSEVSGRRATLHLLLPNVGAPAPVRGVVTLRSRGALAGSAPLHMSTGDWRADMRITVSRALRALLDTRGSAPVDIVVDARYAHGGARRTSRTSTRLESAP